MTETNNDCGGDGGREGETLSADRQAGRPASSRIIGSGVEFRRLLGCELFYRSYMVAKCTRLFLGILDPAFVALSSEIYQHLFPSMKPASVRPFVFFTSRLFYPTAVGKCRTSSFKRTNPD